MSFFVCDKWLDYCGLNIFWKNTNAVLYFFFNYFFVKCYLMVYV